MDLNINREVEGIAVPSAEARSAMGNSIALTASGDFFFLDNSGAVYFTNIRTSSAPDQKKVQPLPLPAAEVDLSNLRHICTNSDASLLCLWSDKKAVVLEIPDAWLKEGTLKITKEDTTGNQQERKNSVVSKLIFDSNLEAEKHKIAKVSFHPANEHSIVLLFETDKLIVYDARSMQPQTFYLPREHAYTSFTFGPNLEWLRYTIFLTTTSNKLYAISPIIPFGTLVSSDIAEELWTWFEETEGRLLGSSSSSNKHDIAAVKYVELMRNYLLGMVGKRSSINKDSFVVAGETDELSYAYKLSSGIDNTTYASVHAIFDRHRLHLQGPLALNTTSSSSNQTICDITIPSVKYSDISPPVIVVAYTSGKVDVLLLDAKDTSTWFISPTWSSINHTRPMPSLVVADTFSACDTLDSKGSWRIIPDPAFAHNFYLYESRLGQVYLISSGWLQSSLKSIAQALNTLANGDTEGKASDATDLIADRTPSPSQCLPIYVPSPHSSLNGIFVVQDPFVGHVAFIRLDSKELIAINITMHTKLCQLQMSIEDQELEPSGNLHKEFDKIMRSDNIIWRHAHDLLLKIAKGLKVLPTLEVTVNSESDSVGNQSDAQNKKFLLETVQILEKNVILPMKELKECTMFHLNIVEQMFKVQQELIEGRSSGSNRLNSSKHTPGDLSVGLRTLIQDLMEENQQLVERLDNIESKYSVLKDQTETILSLIYARPKKLSDAEILYKNQLQEWTDAVTKMTKDIEVVRKLAKPAPKVYPYPANQNEGKTMHTQSFASPSATLGGTKAPSTPFTPSFNQASTNTPLAFSETFTSPLKGFGSPSSKLDISANPSNLSWSTSKILHNNTPSKLGFNSSYQQSPVISSTKKSASFVNTPKADSENPSVQVTLSEDEEKACNELLKKQTELLVAAKRKVEELEKKVCAMKLETEGSSELK